MLLYWIKLYKLGICNKSKFFYIGGGFDLDQAVVGHLGDFSMWDREMSANEVNSIGCDKTGVISSLPTMMVRGERKFSEQKLPNCNRK